jgi:hypothetical protein
MLIAGIGSRNTPQNILNEMIAIGAWCKKNKVWIRSGHAPGADWAFEQGAQEYCITYLPWKGFNTHLQSQAHRIIPQNSNQLQDMVTKFHPAPNKLSKGAYALIARNACQVLGINLKKPVQVIICWTSDGKASGGTGQALRIAIEYNIPVYNMYSKDYENRDKIISLLELANKKKEK